MSTSSGCHKLRLALAAEGTEAEVGAIQHNLPVILLDEFACSNNTLEGLSRIKSAGPVVISSSHQLPYAPETFDEIIVNGAPVCRGCDDGGESCDVPPSTFLGPVYCLHQLMVLLKEGGTLCVGEECWVGRGGDGRVRHESRYL